MSWGILVQKTDNAFFVGNARLHNNAWGDRSSPRHYSIFVRPHISQD